MNGEWPDGWLRRGRDGACERMRRETECEAAVYLPNKLDRISSIIKEEREMGKTQTYTHIQRHLCVSGTQHASFTHTYLQIDILAHVQCVLPWCVSTVFVFSPM